MVAPQLKDRFFDAETALSKLKAIDLTRTSNSLLPKNNNLAIASMIIVSALLTRISLPQLFTAQSATKASFSF